MITEPFYVNIVNAIKQVQVAPERDITIHSGTPLWQTARVHYDHIYRVVEVHIKDTEGGKDADDRIA